MNNKKGKSRDPSDFMSYIDDVDYSGYNAFGDNNENTFQDKTNLEGASSIIEKNDLFGIYGEDNNTYDFFSPTHEDMEDLQVSRREKSLLKNRSQDLNLGSTPQTPREGQLGKSFDSSNPISYSNPNAVRKRTSSYEALY